MFVEVMRVYRFVWPEAHWYESIQRAWVQAGEGGKREVEQDVSEPHCCLERHHGGKYCIYLKKKKTGRILLEERMTFDGLFFS